MPDEPFYIKLIRYKSFFDGRLSAKTEKLIPLILKIQPDEKKIL
jgi:hypothetical protein